MSTNNQATRLRIPAFGLLARSAPAASTNHLKAFSSGFSAQHFVVVEVQSNIVKMILCADIVRSYAKCRYIRFVIMKHNEVPCNLQKTEAVTILVMIVGLSTTPWSRRSPAGNGVREKFTT